MVNAYRFVDFLSGFKLAFAKRLKFFISYMSTVEAPQLLEKTQSPWDCELNLAQQKQFFFYSWHNRRRIKLKNFQIDKNFLYRFVEIKIMGKLNP